MDSPRSAKRRKLDTLQHDLPESSPAARRKKTPVSHPENNTPGSSTKTSARPTPTTNRTKSTSAAHDAWQEAKAKSQASRGKRASTKATDLSVYDDIEGAHAHQPTFAQRTTAPASAPAKKTLDPLRNQKSSSAVNSSPSKGASTLGFFKQFHQPKLVNGVTTPKLDLGSDQKVNDIGSHDSLQNGDDAVASAKAGNDHPSRGDEDNTPNSRAGGRWFYADQPKKTFEDEIRDLEKRAREQADQDEDGTPNAALSREQRKRIRTPRTNGIGTGKEQKAKAAKHRAHTKIQPPKGRREKRAAQPEPDVEQQDEFADPMEIDTLADNVPGTNQERAKQTFIQPSARIEAQTQHPTEPIPISKDTSFSAKDLEQIQTILLERLTGKRANRLTNLENEYAKVSNLISQTIAAGESNSMLVIGARGSGKSALVNQILAEQAKEHPHDFHVVRLNGFIHTDDKIALREIWRQIGREMELDEEESTTKNYADTLTTLLALLSHPTEQGREESERVTKSVIFVIDEFELFASHPRQTLLYNLFDIAQSRKAPIAVLGLTTRIDVAESLEKRVKSRFSHRYVHLGMAKTLAAFQEACKAVMSIHHDELSFEEPERLGASSEVTEKLEKAAKKQKTNVTTEWNTLVEQLITHEVFTTHLHRIYYTTKSIPDFHASLLTPICTLPSMTPTTSTSLLTHFTTTLLTTPNPFTPDSKLPLLPSLSTLHLALLISAARLTNIHNAETVPFAQAYEEYKSLASKAKLQASASGALAQGAAGSRVWGKEVAKGAWEGLLDLGLVVADAGGGGRVDVGLEEIGMSGVELGGWGRWCSEI